MILRVCELHVNFHFGLRKRVLYFLLGKNIIIVPITSVLLKVKSTLSRHSQRAHPPFLGPERILSRTWERRKEGKDSFELAGRIGEADSIATVRHAVVGNSDAVLTAPRLSPHLSESIQLVTPHEYISLATYHLLRKALLQALGYHIQDSHPEHHP